MDSDAPSLLRHPPALRPRIQAPNRTRTMSAAAVVVLHGALLVLFMRVQDSAFSDSNVSGAAGSGSLIEISLASTSRAAPSQESPPLISAPTTSRAAATKASSDGRQPLRQNRASITSVLPDSGSAAASGQQTPALSLSADGENAGVVSEFERTLLAHIEAYRRYPATALRDRPLGVVEVIFAMDRNGIVLDIRIKQSSGSSDLDKEAVAAVLRAQPLPHIPEELPEPLNITLPVSFEGP